MARNTFLLLAALIGQAAATCYLEDANAKCSVCWKTVYGSAEDTTGVTTMSECPEGIAVSWQTPVPDELFAGSDYPVTYRLNVDEAKFPVVSGPACPLPIARFHAVVGWWRTHTCRTHRVDADSD
jgi:hypothetical protein